MTDELSQFKPSDPELSPPQFSLSHLMILIAAIGVLLAINEYIREGWWNENEFVDPAPRLRMIFDFLSTCINGMGLAAVFWLWRWQRRVGPFQFQPGHWLIAAMILELSVTFVVTFTVLGPIDLADFAVANYRLFHAWTCSYDIVYALVISAAFFCTSGTWKWVFGIYSFALLLNLVWLLPYGLFSPLTDSISLQYAMVIMEPLALFLILAIAIDEISKMKSRDWIHYCGVSLPLLDFASQTVWQFVYYAYEV